ncbi:MAG: hypothetical protein OEY11_05875 [Gammaproteobacteria bacterium]|nr:hypothetical protein [Gammaproteobacteria bacterium]
MQHLKVLEEFQSKTAIAASGLLKLFKSVLADLPNCLCRVRQAYVFTFSKMAAGCFDFEIDFGSVAATVIMYTGGSKSETACSETVALVVPLECAPLKAGIFNDNQASDRVKFVVNIFKRRLIVFIERIKYEPGGLILSELTVFAWRSQTSIR